MKGKKLLFMLAVMVILTAVSASPVSGLETEKVRVWVGYQQGQREAVNQSIQGMGAVMHYDFPRLDAFVVTISENAVSRLGMNPHVQSVEVDPVRSLVQDPAGGFIINPFRVLSTKPSPQVVPYGIDMVQARDIWDANGNGKIDPRAPTGEGITVCVIDTGTYAVHEDFVGVDFIGGYSQIDDDPFRDGYGHGTHVAGTIAAANNDLGVVGVTPGTVSLYIVKIFDDAGEWVTKAHASDLVDAIYHCADPDGDPDVAANVISMSLSGTQSSGFEKRAFDELYAAGILHVAAASNEGIEEYHYPASYDSVISVAAINSEYEVAEFSQFNDQVELAAPGVGVLSTIPYIDTSTITVGGDVYSGYHVEYSGRGAATGPLADGGLCETTGDWAGKVVLCYRGDITFYEKVMNVQNSGGIATIIYNNIPDEELLATLGDGNSSEIVAISLTQADGEELLSKKIGMEAIVYSERIEKASSYEAWGGTSMATPHVSGVAALIWSASPDWTNVDIREAMAKTAMDLGDPGRDVHYGYGLVQASDALDYLKTKE